MKAGKTERRRHSRITRELPPQLVDALNSKLLEGRTYEEITEWLNTMGHDISRSGVGRYAQGFLARLERLKLVRDQAKAIIEDTHAEPGTAMSEAASQIAFQLIMEALLTASDKPDGSGVDKTTIEAMKALAQLAKSDVAREKLKYDFTRGRDAAVQKLKEALREELAQSPDLQAQILTLVDRTREQVTG